MTLRALSAYVSAVRGLLAGHTITIDGKPARMMHADGMTVARPVAAEFWLSAFGPRAIELAEHIADGIVGDAVPRSIPVATMRAGTVLDPGEDAGSPRVGAAVGPWQVVAYHEAYAVAGAEAVDAMPGGRQWRVELEALAPARHRHLLSHEGHVTHLSDRDRPLVGYAGGFPTMIGGPDEIRAQLAELEGSGVQELMYTPSGPDVVRELRAFSEAAHLYPR